MAKVQTEEESKRKKTDLQTKLDKRACYRRRECSKPEPQNRKGEPIEADINMASRNRNRKKEKRRRKKKERASSEKKEERANSEGYKRVILLLLNKMA